MVIIIKKNKGPRPSGKFGSKYGKTPRQRFDQADKKAKEKYECPNCRKKALVKQSSGIWKCSKCGTKVSGGAYTFKTGADKILKKALRKGEELVEEMETK
ncbi:MAG: 50S ribosomal protein L37ae [Candidatus Aenigmatarchaeota archaeon]